VQVIGRPSESPCKLHTITQQYDSVKQFYQEIFLQSASCLCNVVQGYDLDYNGTDIYQQYWQWLELVD